MPANSFHRSNSCPANFSNLKRSENYDIKYINNITFRNNKNGLINACHSMEQDQYGMKISRIIKFETKRLITIQCHKGQIGGDISTKRL